MNANARLRRLLGATGVSLWLVMAFAPAASAAETKAQTAPVISVVKSPTCGCCQKWVDRLRAGGFTVEVRNADDVEPFKTQAGVPLRLSSCHTATVAGYFIEGHVPVEDIRRLLAEKPAIRGLTVPGMPAGSPGMEVGHNDPYDVLAVKSDGTTTVFASHGR